MTSSTDPPPIRPDRHAIQVLARSLARDLATDGPGTAYLISLASALLEEATERLRAARAESASSAVSPPPGVCDDRRA